MIPWIKRQLASLKSPLSKRGKSDGPASLFELHASVNAIRSMLREVEAQEPPPSPETIITPLIECKAALAQLADLGTDLLERLSAQRVAAGQYFRLVQSANSTFRVPADVDPLNTVMIAGGFTLLEGALTGALLVANGRLDVPTGLALGSALALTSTILGLVIGFLPLRYINYVDPAHAPGLSEETGLRAGVRVVRGASAIGLVAGFGAAATLLFSGARLRATGGQTVFNFSETGLFQTFDDALSLTLIVIGACSLTLAIKKGRDGIADPVPGLAEAYARVDMSAQGEDIADDFCEAIEDACEDVLDNAREALEDARRGPQDQMELLSRVAGEIDVHNAKVSAALAADTSAGRKRRDVVVHVTRRPQAAPSPRKSLRDLMLPGVEEELARVRAMQASDLKPVQAAIGALESERTRCIAAVEAALAEFLADAPNLDALFDEGEDHHG